VIGGGDWAPDRLLPDAARAFSGRRTLIIRNPDALRPWQHVCEPVSGYLTLARALVEDGPRHATAWNFGPSDDEIWRARRVAETFVRCWGEPLELVFGDGAGPEEARVLRLDSTQATALLGWRPRLRLEEAIGDTAIWYKAYHSGMSSAELLELTRSQLRTYAVSPALS
jgi:CDP-glucose 4,6-dehydratase